MPNQKTNQKICIPREAINGFCYPFAEALLAKIEELQAEDRIFEEGLKKAHSRNEQHNSSLTSIAYSVLEKICQQVEYSTVGSSSTPLEVQKIINLTREFLKIFEIK